MENLRSRTIAAIIGLGLAVAWFAPNVIDVEKHWWPTKKKLNYGLDIQGGLHLVMGVDVASVVAESTTRLAGSLKSELESEGVSNLVAKATNPSAGEVQIAFQTADKEKVVKYFSDRYATMLQLMNETADSATYRYYDSYLKDYQDKVLQQAIETIRNRIDEFGVAEPSIQKQGIDRILIQLPGMADAEKAKQLINTAAKLDFMLVEEKDPAELMAMIAEVEKTGNYSLQNLKYTEYVSKVNSDLKSKLPENTQILFEKNENAVSMDAGKMPFLVRTDTHLGGDALDDAFVGYNEYGAPEVRLKFNALGANKFKVLTGQNVGRRMAVVLDKVIKTAPNIQTEIGTGSAVITLGSARDRDKSMDEAKMISTSLRAGALPVSLQQLEERRVGPTLGADSVKKAQLASWIGAIAILIFMALRYKTMGLIADVCMALNVFSMIALLSSLGATLTLPGIAGIALTVGFAVDSNVLIFERMREEYRKGSNLTLAVKEGYSRALSAIIDSNITVSATAVILLFFGTGPVKGFAVTLLIGIVTTLFANVFMSKWLVDVLAHKFNVKKFSI